jgi:glycosyltransferase involved in cell wall biosynthesis
MKVLHVFITLPVGGAEDLVLSLVRNAPSGDLVEIACLKDLGPAGEEALALGLPVHHLSLLSSKRLNFFAILRLGQWIKAHGYEVVHSHVYNAHVYAVPAARIAGVPAIIHHHKTFQQDRLRRWLLLRLLSKLASAQIALSDQTRSDLMKSLRISPHSFFSLPNAVDSKTFCPSNDRGSLRQSLGLPLERKIFGSVASLTPPKNHAASVEAMATVLPFAPEILCIICGEGRLRPDLQSQIESRGMAASVRLLGNQRPVLPWIQSLDFLLMPSLWEGQPMILLQAISCGIPILASRIEGNVAALGENHPGLFDLDAPGSYAATLRRATKDEEFRMEILDYQARLKEEACGLPAYLSKLRKIYQTCFHGEAHHRNSQNPSP